METLEAEPTINALDELSKLDVEKPAGDKPAAAKPPEKPAAKVPAEKKEPEAPDKTAEKPNVETKPVGKKAEPVAAKKDATPASPANENNIKALRESRDRFESESKTLSTKLKELEKQVNSSEPSKEHQEALATRDKTIRELQAKLGEHDYTQSEDYQSQFYKPYVATWTRALQSVMSLKSEVNGKNYTPTREDAEYLLQLPEKKMLDEARQIFGEDIGVLTLLTTHRARIVEANERLQEARGNAQKSLEEKRSKQAELDKTTNDSRAKLWHDKNTEIAESDPWFKADEADPESGELLIKGYAEVDQAFSDDPKITPDQRIEAHAKLRHQAAAYHRLVAAVKSRDEKIAAYEEELKGFRASEPTSEKTAKNGKVEGETTFQSIASELEELDRKGS